MGVNFLGSAQGSQLMTVRAVVPGTSTVSSDSSDSTTRSRSMAMLFRKSDNTAVELSYLGHLLIENRNGLIVDADLTQATGFAERDCATGMLARLPAAQRRRTAAAGTACPNGSASRSRNPSAGSRPSAPAVRSATSTNNTPSTPISAPC